MQVYKYKAISSDGSNTDGIIDAESVKAASEKLKKKGLYPSSISEAVKSRKKDISLSKGSAVLSWLLQQDNFQH